MRHRQSLIRRGVVCCAACVLILAGCSSSRETSQQTDDRAAAAEGAAPAAVSLSGRSWSLTTLEGGEVPARATDRRHPSLRFDEKERRVTGFAGVNQFGGPYTVEGQRLSFGNLVMTRMAGTPEAMQLEKRFTEVLEGTDRWRVVGGKLELLAGDRVLARFE